MPDFPYADYARSLGPRGIRVEQRKASAAAWEDAVAADRRVLLAMVADPNVPPLPPQLAMPQTRRYRAALLRRDDDAGDFGKGIAKERWAGTSPETAER